mmetsp:Transcript_102/g.222  ORF Transcript_102/g.222 Transcript_102/m.222 type:complete len:384 (-) Transcript_102:682-1833(-)
MHVYLRPQVHPRHWRGRHRSQTDQRRQACADVLQLRAGGPHRAKVPDAEEPRDDPRQSGRVHGGRPVPPAGRHQPALLGAVRGGEPGALCAPEAGYPVDRSHHRPRDGSARPAAVAPAHASLRLPARLHGGSSLRRRLRVRICSAIQRSGGVVLAAAGAVPRAERPHPGWRRPVPVERPPVRRSILGVPTRVLARCAPAVRLQLLNQLARATAHVVESIELVLARGQPAIAPAACRPPSPPPVATGRPRDTPCPHILWRDDPAAQPAAGKEQRLCLCAECDNSSHNSTGSGGGSGIASQPAHGHGRRCLPCRVPHSPRCPVRPVHGQPSHRLRQCVLWCPGRRSCSRIAEEQKVTNIQRNRPAICDLLDLDPSKQSASAGAHS